VHPGSILAWVGEVAGALYLGDFAFSLLRRRFPRLRWRRPRASLLARLADAIGVAAAIALVFVTDLEWKIVLAVCLGLAFVIRVFLEARDRRRPLSATEESGPPLTVQMGQYQRNPRSPESVRCEVRMNNHTTELSFTVKLWQRVVPESRHEGVRIPNGQRCVPLYRDGLEFTTGLFQPLSLAAGESRREWITWRWPSYGPIEEHVEGGALGAAGDDLLFSVENHTHRHPESELVSIGQRWPE